MASSTIIKSNEFSSNGVGLYNIASYATIDSNTINYNKEGIYNTGSKSTINKNKLKDNRNSAIYNKGSSSKIQNNIINSKYSKINIILNFGSDTIIRSNTIKSTHTCTYNSKYTNSISSDTNINKINSNSPIYNTNAMVNYGSKAVIDKNTINTNKKGLAIYNQ